MTRKSPNITNKLYPCAFIALILFGWWLICALQLVPEFMLPSPGRVVRALVGDAPLLLQHTWMTMKEAVVGLAAAIVLAFIVAVIMDRFEPLYKAAYPVIVISQTVPTIAIAPLLVLWLGYGVLPKIVLIIVTCFFPVTIGLLSGFRQVDADIIRLFESMGASRRQILLQVKLPYALESFFAGLKIATAYAVVGAVIAEWLGGSSGLGVYMTLVRKSYAFDKMFASIFVISGLSLVLMWLTNLLQRSLMPWKKI